MEREKQKKIDKERQKKEREEYLKKKREEEEQVLNNIDKTESAKAMIPQKSKFDTDSEDEESKRELDKNMSVVKQRKSRFQNSDSPENASPKRPLKIAKEPSPPPEPPKSREELMEEVVRIEMSQKYFECFQYP